METVQDTPSHCFAYCEEMRGCGKCPKFSWSAKTLQCIFSMEPRESCDEGYDINFDSYKASGTCPAKDGDGTSARRRRPWRWPQKLPPTPFVE